MGTAADDADNALPNYYTALGVDYRAKQDAIRDAFLALTSQAPVFHKHKELICEAFMCLASSDDRASYDAFYFHTPCWHSKALWLAYRNERRRLAWDTTAEINTRYLADIQTAVAEATHAVLAEAAANPAAAAEGAATPSKRPPRMHRHRQRKRTRDAQRAKEQDDEREREQADKRGVHPANGPDSRSDSGQSDFTMVEAVQDSPVESAPHMAVEHQALNHTVAAAVTAVRREEARVDVGVPGVATKPANDTAASSTVSSNAHKALPVRALPRQSVPKANGVTANGAGSSTVSGRTLPLQLAPPVPVRPRATSTRLGNASTTQPTSSASKSRHAPAKPALATTKGTGKTATPAAARMTRAPASTATAMTASVALKARAVQRPALASAKPPATTRPTGTSASKSAATAASPARGRMGLPIRAPAPKTAAPLTQKTPTAAAHSSTRARAAAPASSATVVQAAAAAPSKDSNVPPLKRASLANSRWADPQTCVNGQPGHPQASSNWKWLSRPGKCTACGSASPGRPATLSSHLYWCGKCDASFCIACYTGKIIRRQ